MPTGPMLTGEGGGGGGGGRVVRTVPVALSWSREEVMMAVFVCCGLSWEWIVVVIGVGDVLFVSKSSLREYR